MSAIMSLVSEADAMALALEQCKGKIELAKLNLEAAKQEMERIKEAYEEILGRAEELGVAKSKIKKIVEERVQEMNSLGLVDLVTVASADKVKRPARVKKKPVDVMELGEGNERSEAVLSSEETSGSTSSPLHS